MNFKRIRPRAKGAACKLCKAEKHGRVLSIRDKRALAKSSSEGYVSIAGIAPDFTDGMDSTTYLKDRW